MDSHLPKNICIICLTESSLRTMKNALYFTLKTLFVLKIFKFLSWVFGHVGKTASLGMIRLTSKFMTSQSGYQTIAIHIFPNISQNKSNQTMKLGQLIEYNTRNIFLQKLCRELGRETSPGPLFIFQKSLIWDNRKWSAA